MNTESYLYNEQIKGDVHKFLVASEDDGFLSLFSSSGKTIKISSKVYPDGSYYDSELGSLYPETDEWKSKYQESLYLRVSQINVNVYFVMPVKRGKVNTKAMVVSDDGVCYHTFVPTIPEPRLGQGFSKLLMELEVVSLSCPDGLLKKIHDARLQDSSL